MTATSLPLSTPSKRSIDRRAWGLNIIVLVGLSALLLIMLLPVGIVTINSFKTETEYYDNGPFALPQSLNTDVIVSTWQKTDYTTKLINSLGISLSVALLSITLSLMNAYALGV